ncbi:hypothetical protein AGMMS50262_17610 [Bacteroidia bacterium]|nr:hypothetical protein AGMMS50262_17610 [Bacteroidia bacterium]
MTRNDKFSEFSLTGDFLTNKFGASYAGQTAQGYLDTQYSTHETALKIPIGNGTVCLLLIAGIYVLTVVFGKIHVYLCLIIENKYHGKTRKNDKLQVGDLRSTVFCNDN